MLFGGTPKCPCFLVVVVGLPNELYMMTMTYTLGKKLMTQICKIRGIVTGDNEQKEPVVITHTEITFYLTTEA